MIRYAWLLLLPVLWFSGAEAFELRFYGDVLLSRGVAEQARMEGIAALQKRLVPFLTMDGIHIANLEGALGSASACVRKDPLCFAIPPDLLPLLKGFQVIGLENNHALDLGWKGREDTIGALKDLQIEPLGGLGNTVVLRTDRGDMAILALTDVVNTPQDPKDLHMLKDPSVLPLIRKLKQRATLVAVFVHWGRELDELPTERMRWSARSFIQSGADLVVGTHPHVVGQVEIIQGRPVVYSLGNFLFDQKYAETKTGAILHCAVNSDDLLHCRLGAVQTPQNSFLPEPKSGEAFVGLNEILQTCNPRLQPTWAGVFSSGKQEKRLQWKPDKTNSDLSYIELLDPGTETLECRSPSLPIQKLEPVDLNGDGILEIAMTLKLYSSLDNKVALRIHIYSLNPRFHALWRGSALSRPLEDALFVNGKGGAPLLIALHRADTFLLPDQQKPGRILMSYKWNGFGFSGIKEYKTALNGHHLSLGNGNILLADNHGTIVQEIPIAYFTPDNMF